MSIKFHLLLLLHVIISFTPCSLNKGSKGMWSGHCPATWTLLQPPLTEVLMFNDTCVIVSTCLSAAFPSVRSAHNLQPDRPGSCLRAKTGVVSNSHHKMSPLWENSKFLIIKFMGCCQNDDLKVDLYPFKFPESPYWTWNYERTQHWSFSFKDICVRLQMFIPRYYNLDKDISIF